MGAITQLELVVADAVGSTAGSLEDIGTITTLAGTTDIMALWFNDANTSVRTAGEANQGEFIVDSEGILPQNIRVAAGFTVGGGPATNIEGTLSRGKLLKILPTAGAPLGNARINCDYDIALEATAEMAAQFGAFYAVGTYPPEIMKNYNYDLMDRIRHVASITEPDLGNAVSEAFPESATLSGNLFKAVVAIGNLLSPDAALTAGEHLLGYNEFSGTLGGMDRQQYPMPSIGASLGTPVGIGIYMHEMIMPAYWALPKNTETINATGVIQATQSGVFQDTVNFYLI